MFFPDLMEKCALFHEKTCKNHEKSAALIFEKQKIMRTRNMGRENTLSEGSKLTF